MTSHDPLDQDHPLNRLEDDRVTIDGAQLRARQNAKAARALGATWEAIGAAFGITKQAAQQRWG